MPFRRKVRTHLGALSKGPVKHSCSELYSGNFYNNVVDSNTCVTWDFWETFKITIQTSLLFKM